MPVLRHGERRARFAVARFGLILLLLTLTLFSLAQQVRRPSRRGQPDLSVSTSTGGPAATDTQATTPADTTPNSAAAGNPPRNETKTAIATGGPGFGVTVTNGGNGIVSYRAPLLAQELAVTDPNNHWSYFFDLKPGFAVLPTPYVEIYYKYSSTLLRGRGSMTVTLNDIPLESSLVPTQHTVSVKWKVQLPIRYLRAGPNSLVVSTRQSSIDVNAAPCQDVDNRGNWIRFGVESALYISRKELGTYSLVNYPFPYFDRLAPNPVQAAIVISPSAGDDVVSAMLNMASDVGFNTQLPMTMRVRGSGALSTGRQSVFVGLAGQIPYPADTPLQSGIGALAAFESSGKPQLSVVGNTPAGLDAVVSALAAQNLVAQMEGPTIVLASKPTLDSNPAPRARIGPFPFSDLITEPIHLKGGFHQHQTLTVLRPIRTALGRDSEIQIHFRHSASLNPLRSLLTIFMNGIPIGSSRLDPSNANGGLLTANIPIDQLHHSRWIFDFDVYHDLGSADCSKEYEDVAWTVIETDSVIDLKPGLLPGHPYLEDFPYLIPRTGVTPIDTTVFLSQHPSDTEYSVAASIAARAAQTNGTPVRLSAIKGQVPSKIGTDSAIMVGYYSEADRFASIRHILLVAPGAGNQILISPHLGLLHAPLRDGVLLQAVLSPWSATGVLYVLLAPDDDALAKFNHFLSSPRAKDLLAGQALLYTRDGRALELDVTTNSDRATEENIELDSYSPTMRIIAGVAVLVLIVLIVLVALQFVKRTPKGKDDVLSG